MSRPNPTSNTSKKHDGGSESTSSSSLSDSHFQLPIRRLPTKLSGIEEGSQWNNDVEPIEISCDMQSDDSWEAILTPTTTSNEEDVDAPKAAADGGKRNRNQKKLKLHSGKQKEAAKAEILGRQGADPADHKDFCDAIMHGNYEAVEAWLEEGMSVWQETGDGTTPLIIALRARQADIARLLLERGASVHHRIDTLSPMMIAISGKTDAPRLMQVLIDYGVDPSVTPGFERLNSGFKRFNYFHRAAFDGAVDAVDFLVSHGMDLETRASGGQTALMLASEHGHLTVVKVLVAKGADIRATSDNGRTALLWAAGYGHFEIVRFFLDQGMDVNDCDSVGFSALSCLSCAGSVEGVKLAIERGAFLNPRAGMLKYTPLMNAAIQGHVSIVQTLIEHGADISLTSLNDCDTATSLSLSAQHIDAARMLLQEMGGSEHPQNSIALQLVFSESSVTTKAIMTTASIMFADLCSTNKEVTKYAWIGWILEQGDEFLRPYAMSKMMDTAMHEEDIEIVSGLLSHGANPDKHLSGGYTALMLAVYRKNLSLASVLLEAGADPAAISADPAVMHDQPLRVSTPLHRALAHLDYDLNKDTSLIDLLLESGRCKLMKGPNLQSSAFHYVLQHYRDWDHGVAEILTFRMLKTLNHLENDRADDGSTLLHAAVYHGREDLVEILLVCGMPPNVKDNQGCTPFMRASLHSESMMRYLLGRGADAFAVDNDGRGALHMAAGYREQFNPMLNFLRKTGLNIDAVAKNGDTPLAWAIKSGSEHSALTLLHAGAEVHTKRFAGGETILHLAAKADMSMLLNSSWKDPPDVNAKDDQGYTALARAAMSRHMITSLEMTKALLGMGANMEIANDAGDRPLHLALLARNEAVAQYLIDQGANTSAPGEELSTPLHLAIEIECHEIATALIDMGEDMEAVDSTGQTPLLCADDAQSVDLLLEHGANISFADTLGWTALHLAVDRESVAVFETLVKAGADVEVRTLDDKMSVRDRIMDLDDEDLRPTFWHAILECPQAREKIGRGEREHMQRAWDKFMESM